MSRKSYIFPFLISFVVLASLSSIAQAIPTSFSVKIGEDVSRPIDLVVDDRVLIQFTVVGTIGFSMISPNGTITDFGETGKLSFNFLCTEKGQYTLHFVNTDPTAEKLVTMDCKIDHYVFGMTTNLFWIVFIALVCIAGAVGYVILSKTS